MAFEQGTQTKCTDLNMDHCANVAKDSWRLTLHIKSYVELQVVTRAQLISTAVPRLDVEAWKSVSKTEPRLTCLQVR